MPQAALKYDVEVMDEGKVELRVPFPRGSRVTVFVIEEDDSSSVPVEAEQSREGPDRPMESTSEGVHRFLSRDVSSFTEQQREAYARVRSLILHGRSPNEPRILGLFEGLVEVADDFDAPLPDEEEFWGKGTDAYGLTQAP
ncbi:MAG: hypothetical protein M3220_19830 [Chloroflexota bacterium]|nr:hypothetical protein [Chloroflexota bacterium]